MSSLTHDRLSHKSLGHKHLSSGLSHKVSELQPLPNPHTWLRFDEENCTLSGSNILSVNDKSGNGNHHFALGVGSQQPTLKDNVIGKRQGAKFVRINQQWLFCNALHEPITAGAGVFVVVNELVVGSGTSIDTYFAQSANQLTGMSNREDSSLLRVDGAFGSGTHSSLETPLHQPATCILYGNWGDNARIWINNTQLANGVTQAGSMTASWISAYKSTVGAGNPNYFSELELCEIFVVDYGRDLTEAEIRQQFRYLNSYYGKVY